VKTCFRALVRALSAFPLSWAHALGFCLGWTVYLFAPRYARRLRGNLAQSGVCADAGRYRAVLRAAIAEAGKGVAELPFAWFRRSAALPIRALRGWEEAESALSEGKGVIFVTPHLGAFEIAGRFLAARIPITYLYRPPKFAWLEPVMSSGRSRDHARLVPTDLGGVRALLRALKRSEAVGVLPDQAPSAGEGVWAQFFGRPAYTMTLVGRLQQKTLAPIVIVFAERLPRSGGYRVHVKRMTGPLAHDHALAARQLNLMLEGLIRECPAQYLWSYNRYKVPAGAKPAPAGAGRG
jgi:Kdo2-lipid IVA lauroyltransferase/acyltransferase